MKYTISSVFLLFFCLKCLSQPYFKVADLDSIRNTKTLVYINATWCTPCMAKEKKLIDYYLNHKNDFNLIIIYESSVGIKKTKAHTDTLNKLVKIFYISPEYYNQKAVVQINSQKTAFTKIAKEFSTEYPYENWKDINVGYGILIDDKKPKLLYFDKDKMSDKELGGILL